MMRDLATLLLVPYYWVRGKLTGRRAPWTEN